MRGAGRAPSTSSAIPVGGATEETASTAVVALSSAAAPPAGRHSVRVATAPRSALVTTSTSGTSMIPALRNWRTSPEPGWTTTTTVSATSATSVSDWPTPTVSITTTSNATASAPAAARVAGARPPSRPPAAVERMNTLRSPGSRSIRARSPSSAPPERRELGSTASTATERPPARHAAASRDSSDDLPTPGRPGDADDLARCLAAQRGRGDRCEQRRESALRASGRAALDEVQDRRRRGQVAGSQPGRRASRPSSALKPARRLSPRGARRPARRCRASSGSGPSPSGCRRRRRPPRAARAASASGMIPPTTTGTSSTPASASASQHRRDQLGVRAREDRQPDHVDALLGGRAGDLGRRQADALVDDVHAGVARPDRDLLGAIGVAVEAGLADQELQPPPEGVADPLDLVAQLRDRLARRPPAASPTPVGARYSPNTSRSVCAHSPVVAPARAAAIVAGMMFSRVVARDPGELRQRMRRPRPGRARARQRCSASRRSCLDLADRRPGCRRRRRRSAARARSR